MRYVVKKLSKTITAILLCMQALATSPLSVFADESTKTKPPTEVVQETDTTDTSEEANKPDKPDESDKPVTPDKPDEPDKPVTPEPDKPEESEKPVTPDKPDETNKPVTPDKPVTPVQPATPETPVAPVQPAEPSSAPESAPVQSEATAELVQRVPDAVVITNGSVHFEKNESVDSFIRKIGEPARKIGQEHELYASVMIAQAILESASGQSQLAQAPNYNLFGIKGTHNGKSVSMATQEDFGNGNLYATQAGFRVYENYEDSLTDYAKLIKEGISGNPNYYSGVWKSNAKTYQEATKFLTGKYATDTSYNQKLNGLIETYDLVQYDKEMQGAPVSMTGYQVPVDNYTISSPFGNRGSEFHRGLDMAAAQGEPIHASKAGTVIKAEFHSSWGNYVVIAHADGMTTLYAHQAEYVVKAGEPVEQGQVIGYVGSTGNSTGAHLHVEVCQDSSLSQGMLLDPHHVLFGN